MYRMNNVVAEWPDFYPDNTPPQEATPTNGQSFRLVDSNPPTRDDFRSTIEETPHRNFRDEMTKICACGTSQFGKLEDIQKKRKLFPKLRNKLIAEGQLEPAHGKMLNTFEPSHHTVWYRLTAQPQFNFSVLENI